MLEFANGILIRAATNCDRPHLAAMLSDFADYLNAISPAEFDKQKIDYLVDLSLGSDPVCTTCLAERGGVPIGYVTFHPGIWEIYRAQYVVSLFVRPEARRSGAGTALMEKVRESGKNAGAERIVWFVWKKNPLAIEFYRGLGASVSDDNHLMAWPTT
jgi:ribosomal protein S18 acetylase RimI-like enzyme